MKKPEVEKLWTCDACGHKGRWEEGFLAYYKKPDSVHWRHLDPEPVVIACSHRCVCTLNEDPEKWGLDHEKDEDKKDVEQ